MRTVIAAVLLSSPIVLLSIAATPASADQMIQELLSTNAQPEAAPAAPSTTAPAVEGRGTSERGSQATRRHRVAGSHDERERLKPSQVHG